MNRRSYPVAAAAVLAAISASHARAQLNIMSQSRTLTVTVNGVANPTDADSSIGDYSNSLSNVYTETQGVDGNTFVSQDSGSAAQTSTISSYVLSSQSTADSSQNGPFTTTVDVNDDSFYTAQFSVSSPQTFNLTGQTSTDSPIHEGPDGTLGAYLTLTEDNGTSTQIYSAGYQRRFDGGETASDIGTSVFTPFSTTLEPGFTYTLTLDVYSDSPAEGVGDEKTDDNSATFVATVPEPATLTSIVLVSGTLLARRRQRTHLPVWSENSFALRSRHPRMDRE